VFYRLLTFFILWYHGLSAQTKAVNRDKYRIHISRIEEHIRIDGVLDEQAVAAAEPTTEFRLVTPVDTGYPKARTVSR
jgi:hypothetical protein